MMGPGPKMVATKLQEKERRAIYTHCYGHSLNLACVDTIKQSKLMKDALDIAHEISKLVKKSPRRQACLERLKAAMDMDSPGIRVLCPTRWTVRAETLQRILDNYKALQELWGESLTVVKDTEMKARLQGVASQMAKFDFIFGISLGALVLRHGDELSRTLQKTTISASEGMELSRNTLKTLVTMRSDKQFCVLWGKVTDLAREVNASEPCLPRKRKVPRKLEDYAPNRESEAVMTPEQHYRRLYFEAFSSHH